MATDKTRFSRCISPDLFWDIWCIVSLVGIWPRYIEPNLLDTTRLTLNINGLPPSLKGLKLVHLSDLHFHPRMPAAFLKRLQDKVKALKPDLIVFTGDFICHSKLLDKDILRKFLNGFSAPFGCYAVLGNHDYESPVSVNSAGEYDLVDVPTSSISRGFLRLFSGVKLTKKTTERAKKIGVHRDLVNLIKETPFALLENESRTIAIKGSSLNICGLGEYTLGKSHPEKAFATYDKKFPGIILTHNPDSIPLLKGYPGDIVLCGHTHGGQVYLPWIWKKLTLMENSEYLKGLFRSQDKWIYISRGLGSVMPFRWFSRPEIIIITLE